LHSLTHPQTKGEYHANNQTMAKLLHKAIGLGDGSKADNEAYKSYQVGEEVAAVWRMP
jgi:hypothetical protein